MSQKSPHLNFTEADIKAIDEALTVLEQKFAPLLLSRPTSGSFLRKCLRSLRIFTARPRL